MLDENNYDTIDLLKDFEQGTLSVRQALEDCLKTIDEHNNKINAIIYMDIENARKTADQCDIDRKKNIKKLPLHGVPVTIKECFNWKGHPTTLGDPSRNEIIAETDSAVVKRLKNSGAIILGKTNIPTYLRDWETYNKLFGGTFNPYDNKRSAGGSSGGSAAAVAMGFSYADVGTDMGGSIRLPAHYCGVYGLKPTWGSIPMYGHYGSLSKRNPDINVAGPITRSARDLSLFFSNLSDHNKFPSPQIKLSNIDKSFFNKISFAAILDHEECPVDSAYYEELQKLILILKDNGIQVDTKARPDIDLRRYTELMNIMVRAETSTYQKLIHQKKSNLSNIQNETTSFSKEYSNLNSQGENISHHDWLLLCEERSTYQEKWVKFFNSYDFLLCPSAASAAPLYEIFDDVTQRTICINGKNISVLAQHFWFSFASLGGLPACSTPIGKTSQGLPIGIQIIGKPFSDMEIISVSKLINKLVFKN